MSLHCSSIALSLFQCPVVRFFPFLTSSSSVKVFALGKWSIGLQGRGLAMLRLLPMAALPILRHRTIGLGACLADVPASAGTWDRRIGAKICHKLHKTGESFHIVSCSVHISMSLPWLPGNLRSADPTSGGIEGFAKLSVTELEIGVEFQFCAEKLLFLLWPFLSCAFFSPLESLSTPKDCHCTKTESATRTNQKFIY